MDTLTHPKIHGTDITLAEANVGDRVFVIAYREGNKRAHLLEGTVRVRDFNELTITTEECGPIQFGYRVKAAHIHRIVRKDIPPVCDAFKGTGNRCTECRYRRAMHD